MRTISDTIVRRTFYHLLELQVNGQKINNDLFSSLWIKIDEE